MWIQIHFISKDGIKGRFTVICDVLRVIHVDVKANWCMPLNTLDSSVLLKGIQGIMLLKQLDVVRSIRIVKQQFKACVHRNCLFSAAYKTLACAIG